MPEHVAAAAPSPVPHALLDPAHRGARRPRRWHRACRAAPRSAAPGVGPPRAARWPARWRCCGGAPPASARSSKHRPLAAAGPLRAVCDRRLAPRRPRPARPRDAIVQPSSLTQTPSRDAAAAPTFPRSPRRRCPARAADCCSGSKRPTTARCRAQGSARRPRTRDATLRTPCGGTAASRLLAPMICDNSPSAIHAGKAAFGGAHHPRLSRLLSSRAGGNAPKGAPFLHTSPLAFFVGR